MKEQIEEMVRVLETTCDETECNHPTNCDLCQATRLYNAGYRKQSEWISVEDRLPTEHDANENGDILAVTLDGRVRDWLYDTVASHPKYFTHWMPIPEVPKGGAE